MNNKNKILLICIILIIVIVVITGILLIMIYNSENEGTDNNNNMEFEQQDIYIVNTDIEEVINRNKYFAVQKIVSSYFSYIKELNGDMPYHLDEEYREEVIKEQKEEGLKVIKLMSNEYYKNELDNKVIEDGSIYSNYDVKIKNMYITEKSTGINIYFVDILVGTRETQLVIKTDSYNMTFSVFPNSFVEAYNNDKEKIINKITDEEIQKNNYNQYKYTNITDEYMAKTYFDIYQKQIQEDIEEAYNSLDKKYALKRFGNLESYYNYIKSIINENVQISQYLVNKDEDYTEYVVKDQYDNLYIFKETAVMNYTLTLDTYTLEQEKFNTEYEKATNEKKVKMNIDKFFQMINAKDYKAAYAVLSDEFKNNYFKTEESFKNYMKQRVFLYNDVEYDNYIDNISAIYQYNLTLKNRLDETQQVKFDIVMQLKEGTDFVMSFNIE